jgi:hypothetical protein
MRTAALTLALTVTYPAFAFAKDAAPLAVVQKEDIRLLGKLNVNTASRDELMTVPSLDAEKVDELLEARVRGPITQASLASFQLPADVAVRLSTSGPSTFRRIRALPLEIFTPAQSSATR